MSNVVDIRTYKEIDPILRKGDLVGILSIGEEDKRPVGHTAIVVDVLEMLSPDTDAPGQASWLSVAIPDEECWLKYELSLGCVIRILGPEADELKGYQQDSV